MITLTHNSTTVTLPAALYWADEHSWAPVGQTTERTITGALIVQTQARIAGRPITLRPLTESDAWVPRADLERLKTWAAIPGCEMLLSYRGIQYNVTWRHQDGDPLAATPIVHFDDAQPIDWFLVTLNLMEI